MKTLISHLEHYLGRIQEGWTDPSNRNDKNFQIARFVMPEDRLQCFSTIGFSNYGLVSPYSGKSVHAELLMMVHAGIDRPAAILDQIARELIASGKAILRGDVIGPRGRIFDCGKMTALYATLPVYFPDEFSTCVIDEVRKIAIIWLVPITTDEAEFIKTYGWSQFEDRLEKQGVDLTDIERESILL